MPEPFNQLLDIVARLRSPQGCPWDRQQTHESLKAHLLEETHEVLEVLDQHGSQSLKEELGDLLLQILFHAQIEDEHGHFSIHDVITTLTEKLVRRHPHVFRADAEREGTLSPDQVLTQWETLKHNERQQSGKPGSILDGVPKTLPALLRAQQIQSRASRVGFDWERPDQVIDKLDEELEELRAAVQSKTPSPISQHGTTFDVEAVEEEMGDVLLTLVNVARFLTINSEEALRKATNRFIDRFTIMERAVIQDGKQLQDLSAEEWDTLWRMAKATQRSRATEPLK